MKHTFTQISLKGLLFGLSFSLGFFSIVFASNWLSTSYNTGGENLTATEGVELTLSKWNALVGKVSGITTQSNGKVVLTQTSPAITDNNSEIPSTAAVKTYVDAQVQASVSGGGSQCPTQISAEQTATTIYNAINGCRDMGGGYRLPTFEELSCFIGDTSIPGGNIPTVLWTRTESTIGTTSYWLGLSLSTADWSQFPAHSALKFRCIR